MQENNEIIYGKNTVIETIKTKEVSKIFINKESGDGEITQLIKKHNIPMVKVDKKYLDRITNRGSHQGIAALVSPVDYVELNELIQKNKKINNPMVIILDEVTDVNNLGAILRIIDAFGINGVIFNKRRNAQLNGSVAKISTGAINHVDICRVTNIKNTITTMKKNGYWVANLDMNGELTVERTDFNQPLVIVVGGEDKGITDNINKSCDFSITIPMSGHVNSLNVSSAVSILCYAKSVSNQK